MTAIGRRANVRFDILESGDNDGRGIGKVRAGAQAYTEDGSSLLQRRGVVGEEMPETRF